MPTKKILWPTDLSENSLKISRYVSDMAKKFDAQIILLYVGIDLKTNFPAYGNYPDEELYSRFEKWESSEAKKRLESLCEDKLQGCPGYDLRLELGDPATKILEVADRENVDMIIMATHGRNPAAAAANIFGSVAERVIKGASVPLYVINPEKCEF
ncbi:MAG: universal stress protein [Desulfovibrionales bacterium]